MLDVLTVGLACVDTIYQVSTIPAADQKTRASGCLLSGGGPAANAAVTVARLGGQAAFAGIIGQDINGDRLASDFTREGVDISALIRQGEVTPNAVSLVDATGRRTIVSYKPTIEATPPPASLFESPAKVLLLDGHRPEWNRELMDWATRHNTVTVLDGGSVHVGTTELLPLVDYPVVSEAFARSWTGCDTTAEAFLRLSEQLPTIIVTCGSEGVLYQQNGVKGRIPATPVNVVDTTGAGDIFHGAVALALARKMTLEESLDYASKVAACSCQKPGGRTSIPTAEEFARFMEKFKSI